MDGISAVIGLRRPRPIRGLLARSTLLLVVGTTAALAAVQPVGKAAVFLGEQVLWRCREGLVFHLRDGDGSGFRLDVDLRDMNIYQQGERPALLWVTGPQGNTLAKQVIADDGEVGGSARHCDGTSDVYLDFRYREWHRANSPDGLPPGKERSPLLEHPERLEPRRVALHVPPAGPGLYRLVVVAGWDYWVAVSSSRVLAAGVHPGPGPLYLHGDRLAESYLYLPSYVKEVGLSVSEEVRPFGWRLTVEDEEGTTLGTTEPRSFFSYLILRDLEPDSLLRLRLEGRLPGACLHLQGAPFVLCPDAQTARLIHGGVEIDRHGRSTFHGFQRTLTDWAYSLTPEQLAAPVPVRDMGLELPFLRARGKGPTLGDVAQLLASQDLDPASDTFGRFRPGTAGGGDGASTFWRQAPDLLAKVAGWRDDANPFYGHPAVVRRVLLCRVFRDLLTQAPFFWYGHQEGPKTFSVKESAMWSVPMRSNWYPMHDARHALSLGPIRELVAYALPARCLAAWEQSLRCWATSRSVMHQGECSNQWAAGLAGMKDIWLATRDAVVEDVLRSQVDRFTTPGNLGRVSPDPTPFDAKSAIAHGGRAADTGLIGGGVAADGLGHDNEYCLESTLHMGRIWEVMPHPGIERWLNEYYVLKTHLTMPKGGAWPSNAFSDTCSPTDFNHRTGCYTHKSPLGALRPHIRYGDIWGGARNEQAPWPCLEEGTFTRVIDNQYFFVKTPAYYTILYGGMANGDAGNWTKAVVRDGNARLLGYGGMHYTGTQRKPTKIAGISAVWVPDCGPVWLCQNHNVMFTNTVWGRRRTPVCAEWEQGHVDPTVVCAGFSTPAVEWDAKRRRMVKQEALRHAPLRVRRQIDLLDDRIRVDLSVTADRAVDLRELYECLPTFAHQRSLTLYDADFAPLPLPIPKAVTSSRTWQAEAEPGDPRSGESRSLPTVRFRAYDLRAPSGSGALVILDREVDATQTHPVRYRSVAAPTAGLNVVLPSTFEPGGEVRLRYVIVPHTGPVEPEDVRHLTSTAFAE